MQEKNYDNFEIEILPYSNEEISQEEKIKQRQDYTSLSGSKAKQIVCEPYERYLETVLDKKPNYSDEAKMRMRLGIILENTVIYQVIKPEYKDKEQWKNKLIVVDKRRRKFKDKNWTYELDMLVYKLEKPWRDYEDFDSNYADFIIDNTSGAYDNFLSNQEKYAVYDVKVSQIDAVDNYENYKYQLNYMAHAERVKRAGLFVLVKSAKLEEYTKDYDKNTAYEIFDSYYDFVNKIESGYTFEKEKELGVCYDLPEQTEENKEELDKIYLALENITASSLELKNQEKILDVYKDYIKETLPKLTNHEDFNIKYDSANGEVAFYTTKKYPKKEINQKELEMFLKNNEIVGVISKDGTKLDFDINNFIKEKVTGGFKMFRIKPNSELSDKFKQELENHPAYQLFGEEEIDI